MGCDISLFLIIAGWFQFHTFYRYRQDFESFRLPAHREFQPPPQTIPRTRGHHNDFLDAIRNGKKAGSDFADYGGPLTELTMLGIIAMNFPGRVLTWDGPNMRFTDCDEANPYVAPPYRKGWTL